MKYIFQSKESLIKKIVKLEHKMFKEIHTDIQGQKCKGCKETFKLERESFFQPLSNKTLKSYLNGLEDAVVEGRNLMKEKYLKMDESLNVKSIEKADLSIGHKINKTQCVRELPQNNPLDEEHKMLIQKIMEIEIKWQNKLIEKYPNLFKGNKIEGLLNFKKYLTSELETYPPLTIEYYYKDVSNAEREGRNLALEGYKYMFNKSNYSSLEEANQKIASNKEKQKSN